MIFACCRDPLGAELRCKCIALKRLCDLSNFNMAGQRLGNRVDLGPANHPGLCNPATMRDGVFQAVRYTCTGRLPAGLTRDDDVGAAWQGPKTRRQGVPGLAPHDDGPATGQALEMDQILRQVPGQLVVVANHAVAGAGINHAQLHTDDTALNNLDRNRCLDGRVMLVVQKLEIFKLVVKNGHWFSLDIQ